jgi:SAM-dependent methyltransferase
MSTRNTNLDEMKKEYWAENIHSFSGFYDKGSEEKIKAPYLLSWAYKKWIFSIEKKYMFKRYQMVLEFLEKNASRDKKIADVGCGSGIYTKYLLERQIPVYALDYTNQALELTKSNCATLDLSLLKCIQIDILKNSIPCVDIAFAIGILPYIEDYKLFFKNILPYTRIILFNLLDSENWINRLRKILPFLNVRYYSYHRLSEIEKELQVYHYKITKLTKLASGWMIEAQQ